MFDAYIYTDILVPKLVSLKSWHYMREMECLKQVRSPGVKGCVVHSASKELIW